MTTVRRTAASPAPSRTVSSPSFASVTLNELTKMGSGTTTAAVKTTKSSSPFNIAKDLGLPELIPGEEKVAEDINKPAQKLGESEIKAATSTAGAVVKTAKAAKTTAEFIEALSELKTWVRVGKVVLGGVLILVGIWMLLKAASPTAASVVSAPARYSGKAAKAAVTTAVPEARAAKLGARAGAAARARAIS